MRRAILMLMAGAALQAQNVPEIAFDSTPNLLQWPEHIHLGEAAGVATNSKGNIFVYTRTGGGTASIGGSRTFTHGGSRLFEFDRNGKYVREIGKDLYGFLFAQAVRVDGKDHIWVVDRGSNMVIEFDPEGHVLMTLSRKPESVAEPGRGGGAAGGRGGAPAGGRGAGRGPAGAGVPGDNFNKPTDVAWDSKGNIYVADGYGNARIAKIDAKGTYVKSWGSKGSEPGQFDTPLSIATDAHDNLYVADRGNKRIQVFDTEGTFKTQFTNVGAPWAICVSPGAHQYLYSSNSNDPGNLEDGEIYKMELDGKVIGKFGRAGKLPKEFGTVNSMDCRTDLLVGEVGNWRVQRLKLR